MSFITPLEEAHYYADSAYSTLTFGPGFSVFALANDVTTSGGPVLVSSFLASAPSTLTVGEFELASGAALPEVVVTIGACVPEGIFSFPETLIEGY